MNIHYANPADVITDEYGWYAPVLCGVEGSYCSLNLEEVNCATCLERQS